MIGLPPGFASLEDKIARFDFSICMAAFDGGQTMQAAEFDHDETDRTFTLYRADNQQQFDYSMSRFEKITSARYAGWSLVVPGEFEGLAKEHALRRHWYRCFSKGFYGQSILKPKERIAARQ